MTAKRIIIELEGNRAPSLARLDNMAAELRRGDSLSVALRRDLIDLVEYVAFKRLVKESAHAGRPTDTSLKLWAAIVYELHVTHKIKIEAAVSAIVNENFGTEDSRRKLRQTIERAYQTLKASGERYPVNERLVLEALARINPPRKVK